MEEERLGKEVAPRRKGRREMRSVMKLEVEVKKRRRKSECIEKRSEVGGGTKFEREAEFEILKRGQFEKGRGKK